MKTVILCGGSGTRLREETEYRPKPMVSIGNKPILWHIMKIYSVNGFKDFVLPLGYKGNMIKEYFIHYDWKDRNFCFNLKNKHISFDGSDDDIDDWNIHFVDTGLNSKTSLRLFRLKHLLKNEDMFMLTYGDGVANIDIKALIEHHKKLGKMVTITALNPRSRYGVLKTEGHCVVDFKEKPILDDIINAGFMVINTRIFDYINDDDISLEDRLKELAVLGEVAYYSHNTFWHCMDTYKDYKILNKMWNNNPEWKIW